MTDLRQAAQRALVALEWSWGGEPIGTTERDAITALKAALAQAEPVQDFRLTECVFVGPAPAPHEDWHHAIAAMLREKHISGLRISAATADDWTGIKEAAMADNITINRATVEQALEALELLQNAIYNIGGEHVTGWVYANDAANSAEEPITVLKAALAQQAEPVQRKPATGAAPCAPSPSFQMNAQGKPVNWADRSEFEYAVDHAKWAFAQQAEPVQAVSGVVIREGLPTLLRDRDIRPTDTRLYTAPPKRKPLTEEEK